MTTLTNALAHIQPQFPYEDEHDEVFFQCRTSNGNDVFKIYSIVARTDDTLSPYWCYVHQYDWSGDGSPHLICVDYEPIQEADNSVAACYEIAVRAAAGHHAKYPF